jgi:hypothetical protein
MSPKTLDELLDRNDPAITLIRQRVESAENQCDILPSSAANEKVLLEVQMTTRSTLGAIAYETGGVLVDSGWLRFLGSGHPRLARTLSDWNRDRGKGLYLVADDAVGGFFAINGGALGGDLGNVYYWPPDSLGWQSLGLSFSTFFVWSLTSRLADFYRDLRWPGWKEDLAALSGDQCFSFYPFLWAQDGSIETSARRSVPVAEAFDLKMDIVRQLDDSSSN